MKVVRICAYSSGDVDKSCVDTFLVKTLDKNPAAKSKIAAPP
jgi:hypothetical protein